MDPGRGETSRGRGGRGTRPGRLVPLAASAAGRHPRASGGGSGRLAAAAGRQGAGGGRKRRHRIGAAGRPGGAGRLAATVRARKCGCRCAAPPSKPWRRFPTPRRWNCCGNWPINTDTSRSRSPAGRPAGRGPRPPSSPYLPELHAELVRGLARRVDAGKEPRLAAALASPAPAVRVEALRAWAASRKRRPPPGCRRSPQQQRPEGPRRRPANPGRAPPSPGETVARRGPAQRRPAGAIGRHLRTGRLGRSRVAGRAAGVVERSRGRDSGGRRDRLGPRRRKAGRPRSGRRRVLARAIAGRSGADRLAGPRRRRCGAPPAGQPQRRGPAEDRVGPVRLAFGNGGTAVLGGDGQDVLPHAEDGGRRVGRVLGTGRPVRRRRTSAAPQGNPRPTSSAFPPAVRRRTAVRRKPSREAAAGRGDGPTGPAAVGSARFSGNEGFWPRAAGGPGAACRRPLPHPAGAGLSRRVAATSARLRVAGAAGVDGPGRAATGGDGLDRLEPERAAGTTGRRAVGPASRGRKPTRSSGRASWRPWPATQASRPRDWPVRG